MAKKQANATAPTYQGTLYLVQEKVTGSIPDELLDMMDELDEETLEEFDQGEGWAPVKAFTDKTAADAHRTELENKRRTKENPFANGSSIADWSHFEEPQFHDWLLDAGLEPPKGTKKAPPNAKAWREWWDKGAKKMTALQRAKVWEACNKVVYYEVVKLSS